MRYTVEIFKGDTRYFNGSADTRADLADMLDACYKELPRAEGYEYSVTCEVIRRYTLVDTEVMATGTETQEKLWSFVQSREAR